MIFTILNHVEKLAFFRFYLHITKWGVLLMLLLAGCTTAVLPAVTPSLPPSPTPLPIASPSATMIPHTPVPPDSGWQQRQSGLDERTIHIDTATLYLVRVDPAQYNFRVGYHAGEGQSLGLWLRESGAVMAINGGYFTEGYEATGLVVSDGTAVGTSHGTYAGMFTVTDAGTSVEWLADVPYFDDKRPFLHQFPIQQATQSFPLLVKPNGVMGYPEEDGIPARRTVVGQDVNGRLLFIIAGDGRFTLHQLSQWLVNSDLELEIALNLDGGTSTGLQFADGNGIPAYTPLPIVILIESR